LSGADKQVEPEYAVFCGLDVGKSEHHACALDAAGKRLHDKALPNDEEALAAVYRRLREHGRVLVVVDQPASIGALSIAVARSLGTLRTRRSGASSSRAATSAPPITGPKTTVIAAIGRGRRRLPRGRG